MFILVIAGIVLWAGVIIGAVFLVRWEPLTLLFIIPMIGAGIFGVIMAIRQVVKEDMSFGIDLDFNLREPEEIRED